MLPRSIVIGAFHHLSAVSLIGDAARYEDVLTCGDDASAKDVVIGLAAAVTGRPEVDAGSLGLTRQLEPLTALFISINKAHKAHKAHQAHQGHPGIRVTGLPGWS
jgi:predicted dinucleotide-binding enzyme